MKLINEDVVQAILRYLITRPYNEVYQVIPILQELPDFVPPEPATAIEESK